MNCKRSFDQINYGDGEESQSVTMIGENKRPKLIMPVSPSNNHQKRSFRRISNCEIGEEIEQQHFSPNASPIKRAKFTPTKWKYDDDDAAGAVGLLNGSIIQAEVEQQSKGIPKGKPQPMFTFEQVQSICDSYLVKHERNLREEYDKILARELAEHFERLVNFTHRKVQKDMETRCIASYIS